MDPVPRSRGHHLIAGEDGLADDHRTDAVAHEVDRFESAFSNRRWIRYARRFARSSSRMGGERRCPSYSKGRRSARRKGSTSSARSLASNPRKFRVRMLRLREKAIGASVDEDDQDLPFRDTGTFGTIPSSIDFARSSVSRSSSEIRLSCSDSTGFITKPVFPK